MSYLLIYQSSTFYVMLAGLVPRFAGCGNAKLFELHKNTYIVYRQNSDISRIKSTNLMFVVSSCGCLCPINMKPRVKSRMKMQLEQRRQAMLQLHLINRQFHCLLRCNLYSRFDVTVKLSEGYNASACLYTYANNQTVMNYNTIM